MGDSRKRFAAIGPSDPGLRGVRVRPLIAGDTGLSAAVAVAVAFASAARSKV